jgi:hypothetical protein
MSEPKRKRRFRFHLLTLVLMALLIGLLIWLNTILYQIPGSRDGFARWRVFGWPIPCDWDPNASRGGDETRLLRMRYGELRVVWNVLVNIAIVSVFAIICELLIRRREGRKP